MRKINKKSFASVAAILMVANSLIAYGFPAADNNSNIHVSTNANRPSLLSGNIRGDASVRTVSTNNNGIRARVDIISRTSSGGTVHSRGHIDWVVLTAGQTGTLSQGTTEGTGTLFGTTRFGTITAQGERRATFAGAWGQNITVHMTW